MANDVATGIAQRKIEYGVQVAKATATLPATAYGVLFTVAGGRVLVTNIVGEVTVIIQAQITTLKVTSTPTVGTAVDMSATVDMNGKEVGCLIGITGLPSDAAVATNAGLTQVMSRRLVIPVGTIGITTGATSTGSIKWTITYIPWDDGAAIS